MFTKFRKATISFITSVCSSTWNNLAPIWQIWMKFAISVCFENLSRKFKFHYNLTWVQGTLHEDLHRFLIKSHSILLIMRNVSDKSYGGGGHILCSIIIFENCAIYEIICKNTVELDRPQITIQCTCIAVWGPKPTNTHTEYAILSAFTL